MKYFYLLFFIVLLSSCKKDDTSSANDNPPNILLIISDDMGKDATAGFSEGSVKPNTPHIDKLKNEGLSFTNFWVYPTCSPTRASIITGKYGYRTGVKWATDEMDPSEKIVQRYINEETNNAYANAVIGKWHLSGDNANFNPESFGLDHYAGLIRGTVSDYYEWPLTENGSNSTQTEYITTAFTDMSIDWLNQQTKPWFLWLAYNAPHTPFHVPPSQMHSQGNLSPYVDGIDPLPYYMAAIEALDFQVGKLIASIPAEELDNTIILFLGDNGSPGQVAQFPYSTRKSKGSLYQGGINVPLFVWGNGVQRTGDDASLINSTDLFSTIANLAGVNISEIHDSKSFKGLLSETAVHRNFQYAEKDDGTDDQWVISNGAYKLTISANGDEEMYNLDNDPYEGNNLLRGNLTAEESNAKTVLEAELMVIRN